MASSPETRYARTADGLHIAFQVSGEGPLDIVEIGDGTLFPIDATSEQARWQAYVDRLASFSRLIRFDLRGIGLSGLADLGLIMVVAVAGKAALRGRPC